MSGLEQLAVVATGLVAGVMTSTVGVASLLSFPVLVALGLPPVVANASNTIGMTPAGPFLGNYFTATWHTFAYWFTGLFK